MTDFSIDDSLKQNTWPVRPNFTQPNHQVHVNQYRRNKSLIKELTIQRSDSSFYTALASRWLGKSLLDAGHTSKLFRVWINTLRLHPSQQRADCAALLGGAEGYSSPGCRDGAVDWELCKHENTVDWVWVKWWLSKKVYQLRLTGLTNLHLVQTLPNSPWCGV